MGALQIVQYIHNSRLSFTRSIEFLGGLWGYVYIYLRIKWKAVFFFARMIFRLIQVDKVSLIYQVDKHRIIDSGHPCVCL